MKRNKKREQKVSKFIPPKHKETKKTQPYNVKAISIILEQNKSCAQ